MKAFLKRKIADPILAFLKQGVTPSKLAWAISLGIELATMPVFGSGTLLCLLAIWLFRLNPSAVLLINQLAYPLQFVLYFPFIRAGECLFQAEKLPLSIAHAGLGITEAEYNAFIGLIVEVLTDAGVPTPYINECFAPTLTDPAFSATIIGK